MMKALKEMNLQHSGLSRFDQNIKEHKANQVARDIRGSQADCVIMVANAVEGAIVTHAIAHEFNEKRIKLISHWGITGGDFASQVIYQQREQVGLEFIQTCFSFSNESETPRAQKVLMLAAIANPGAISQYQDIQAPVGFIHAYDLGKLLVQALQEVDLEQDILKSREQLRDALEQLNEP